MAVPTARPDPVEPKPVQRQKPKQKEQAKQQKPKPQEQKKQQTRPKQQQQPQQARANQAQKATAPAPAKAGANVSPARWQSRVNAHLNRYKRFPSGARSQGTVGVRFTIDPSGRVLAASVSRTSGDAALDQAAVDLVRRASPVPAPPPAIAKSRMTLSVPIRYSRR